MNSISNIENLKEICWDVKKRLLIVLNGSYVEESPTLYHYTSMASAIEILKNSCLHFTDIRFSNDPSELAGGIEILKNAHNRFFKDTKKDDEFFIFMDIILNLLDVSLTLRATNFISDNTSAKFLTNLLRKKPGFSPENLESSLPNQGIFVSCLSEKDDDLRQWIPYADEGRGVAIGFKGLSSTHKICKEDILKVSYQDSDKKEDYALSIYNEIRDIFYHCTPELKQKLFDLVFESHKEDIIASKSADYRDEVEWRAISCKDMNVSNETNFKYSKELIKPYLDVPINKESVVEIVIGPKSDMVANAHAIRLLLNKHGYSKTVIRTSKIKYR